MIAMLSELEQDALLEVMNLGMGQAADSLSEMMEEEVVLSVPRIYFLPRSEVFNRIEVDPKTRMTAVRQTFTGPFHGSTLLIYPREKSLELVRSLLHNEVSLEECREMEQESITEVGNIILNACLGSFANIMGVEILCELPEYLQDSCTSLLTQEPVASENPIMLLFVDFVTNGNRIKGYVILLFDTWTIPYLKKELDSILSSLNT
ncbi:MAG: chemotaxis protein CheC [Magnetococcales bacterium]|nr:chemotaxis protein CheC [Magnetococcales bacterium]MBF0437584.1 chemotaxis protein CheC [Magnetococcales bacterium]